MLAVNSAPLSLYKMLGAPKSRNISKICMATSLALLDVSARKMTNLVK